MQTEAKEEVLQRKNAKFHTFVSQPHFVGKRENLSEEDGAGGGRNHWRQRCRSSTIREAKAMVVSRWRA